MLPTLSLAGPGSQAPCGEVEIARVTGQPRARERTAATKPGHDGAHLAGPRVSSAAGFHGHESWGLPHRVCEGGLAAASQVEGVSEVELARGGGLAVELVPEGAVEGEIGLGGADGGPSRQRRGRTLESARPCATFPAMLLSRRRWLRGAATATAWCGLGAGGALGRAHARARGPGTILEEARSPYNHIVIAEDGPVRTMYFVVDGTWYIESRIDRSRPASLDLDYTRTMMAGFLVQPEPKRILMVGFGGGQISNYLFAHLPGVEIDGVDIDPEVIRLARKYFDVPASPRYRTHAGDGRLFVERAPAGATWDMIILDAFRGVFVPYHLKTAEYYQACLRRLSPDGVVAANLHHNGRMYAHDRATFAAVFPTRYAFLSEQGHQTTLVASASPRWLGAYDLRHGARAAQGAFDFDLLGLAARHYRAPNWRSPGRVLHDGFDPADLDRAAAHHNTRCTDDCPYPTD